MPRTPKTPPPPVPDRRGRKPKAAEPIEFAAATSHGIKEAKAVEVEAATVTPVKKPPRGKPGPKPKPRPEAAMLTLPAADEQQQPAMDLEQPNVAVGQASAQDDRMIAEMAYPVSADDRATPRSRDAGMNDSSPAPSQNSSEQATPAARWDQSTDTVQFDWPAIEQTAAQHGPNQIMAKLLVAARAEGANSRWPL